jgi:hypothetical protein
VDNDNPIVKLCTDGMQAEAGGDVDRARALFAQAWDTRTDEYEACVAAHYVARHQPTPEDTLAWNQTALDCAGRVTDEQIRQFYPSLYHNLGKSYEDLGNRDDAKRYYRLASDCTGALPEGPYGDMVRTAIEAALARFDR